MAGETLVAGRYRPVERVGAGSMGEVWRARDERLHRDVALKLLDLSSAPDPTVAERFRREAIATAQLNHPNVVSVLDAGTDATRAYLVMTLLPGRTIADLVRTEGPMPLERALGLVIQVTAALREAHRHGLVHRDIKPANVMVNGDQATVLDFGIAQLSGLDATLTATHAVIGSAAYMSPEHATGLRAGPASDMYGVGCLLMTMLTGQPPFTGESAVAVASQQVSAEPPALSERIRTPRALDELVASLLAKDAGDRPDASSTLDRLHDIAAHPDRDLVGPVPRTQSAATAVLPAVAGAAVGGGGNVPPALGATTTAVLPSSTAVLPTSTAVMPPSNRVAPLAEAAAPFAGPPYPPPTTPPAGPQTYIPARRPGSSRRRALRPLVWLLVIILGALAFLLGTQAGGLTSLLRGPVASSSPRPSAPTTAPTSPKTSATPTPKSSPTASSKALILQAAVQGVSQVLASLPAGNSKDKLVAEWSTVGAQVLRGNDANDQLDGFVSKVQKEVRTGGVSIPQGVAILAAVEAVRAAL
ncbi:MAG TPA: serine/threonine-protein kinase [Propionibacteriaceae bacterium]|nr:serine/threonine-protein kinase [Propionibacteriaceae bacterium]